MNRSRVSSSPDPISILPGSSPAKSPARMARGPLSPKSSNLQSPSKSILLQTGDHDGKSPWRIRVTVQAEPNDVVDDSTSRLQQRPMGTTTTIPLRDADGSSPVKRVTRALRSRTSTPANVINRKPTPQRRRVTPARRTHAALSEEAEGIEAGPLIDLGSGKISNDYRLQPAHEAHQHEQTGDASDYSLSMLDTAGPQAELEGDDTSEEADESMWKSMIANTPVAATADRNQSFQEDDYSLSEDDEEEECSEGGSEEDARSPGMYTPGDATVCESEEFSMISVDSLSSHQAECKEPINEHITDHSLLGRSSAARDKSINMSYMPSSPPIMLNDRYTPVVEEPSAATPHAPVNSFMMFPHVMTPLRESAVRSGRVLQDIVRGSDQERPSSNSGISNDKSIFGGFSTGTRRQLRASLQMGTNLATNNNTNSSHQSPLSSRSMQPSESSLSVPTSQRPHRLPTPEEHQEGDQIKTSSTDTSVSVRYPDLTEQLRYSPHNRSQPAYDAMSWVPTGPARLASPMEARPGSSSQHKNSFMAETSTHHAQSAPEHRRETIEISSDSSSDEDDAISDDLGEARDQDICQEEASRSIEEDDDKKLPPSPQVQDPFSDPIKPRRSKIPGTWRRASGIHLQYSDSPEPEEQQSRKTSSNESSGKSRGIATPPTSEDEARCDAVDEDDTGAEAEEVADGETPSDTSVSPDGEDTGLFWQANLPSVFSRQQSKKAVADHSVLSDLKYPTSPTKVQNEDIFADHSLIDRSQTDRPLRNAKGASGPAVNTPLRKSLLKSSKIRSSPLGKSVAISPPDYNHQRQHDGDTETTNEGTNYQVTDVSQAHETSIASDTRQILKEMATAQRRASLAAEDMAASLKSMNEDLVTPESSECDIAHSYQEHLNRESPGKIAVKFNDSSMLSSSPLLAPKKTYPSLFDTVPALQPSANPSAPSRKPPTTASTTDQQEDHSLITRLTTNIWSALKTPTAPTPPTSKATTTTTRTVTLTPAAVDAQPTYTAESTSIPNTSVSDTTLRLRRKYGLLPNTHPFTLAHARTLHRMLNSAYQHPSKTLLPLSGTLPPQLAKYTNQSVFSVTSQPAPPAPAPAPSSTTSPESREHEPPKLFEERHLHVVQAFTALLLPPSEIARLESLGKWGDEGAAKAKGWDSRGRHGSWSAFGETSRAVTGPMRDRELREMRGVIRGDFVVGVLGGILAGQS